MLGAFAFLIAIATLQYDPRHAFYLAVSGPAILRFPSGPSPSWGRGAGNCGWPPFALRPALTSVGVMVVGIATTAAFPGHSGH